jgi:Glycosyl transferase family 21
VKRLIQLGTALSAIASAHIVLNARLLRRAPATIPPVTESVTVCLPVRDEEHNVLECVAGILNSGQLRDLSVLVLNDGSRDRTGEILRRLAVEDFRVTVLNGDDTLPSGWIGKPFATEQLRKAASGDVLVFVDADVRLEPHAIAAGITVMREHDFAMVCPYPRQLAVTFGERLVQPLLQWLWLTFLPLRMAEGSRPPSLVAANGQFMVVNSRALDAIGGFESVKGEVLDDVALGRSFKRAGYRVAVVDGTDLATCRMYDAWSGLVDGYTKNLWSATGSPAGASAIAGLLALTFVVPPIGGLVGLLTKRPTLAATGLCGYLFGVAGRVISARTTGARTIDSLLHPVSVGALIMLIVRSWSRKRRGLLRWKGRAIVAETTSIDDQA